MRAAGCDDRVADADEEGCKRLEDRSRPMLPLGTDLVGVEGDASGAAPSEIAGEETDLEIESAGEEEAGDAAADEEEEETADTLALAPPN